MVRCTIAVPAVMRKKQLMQFKFKTVVLFIFLDFLSGEKQPDLLKNTGNLQRLVELGEFE